MLNPVKKIPWIRKKGLHGEWHIEEAGGFSKADTGHT